MCVTCVATGTAYVVPAVVGLRLQAGRLRRRRARVVTSDLDDGRNPVDHPRAEHSPQRA